MSGQFEGNTPTVEFLRAIWPTQGYYCIAVKLPRGMHHQFFERIEEAAAFALGADARGVDVYHGCAAYAEPGSRKGANVRAVKSFWLDIDVGEGKPYADARIALDAINKFVADTVCPQPTCVYSGGGWHLYWRLEREVAPDRWRRAADGLKASCARYGLAADPARTADVASILRPVGTRNHKRAEPQPVRQGPLAAPCTIEEFEQAFGVTPDSTTAVNNDKFQVHTTGQGEPSYGNVIAGQCRQLRVFRDSGGRIPEPQWYANLGVLAHCVDGEGLAHAWSAGDSRYNPSDTERKLRHARESAGPTTCLRFQGINAVPCVGCTHAGRVTSPIQLGRSAAPAAPVASVTLPALPSGFRWGAGNGIDVSLPDPENDDAFKWTPMYKAPVFISSVRKHEHTGQTSLALNHWLPHEGWQEALIPWEDHSPKTVLNRLGSVGINIFGAMDKHFVRYLHHAIDDYQTNRKIDMEYAQFGWKGDFEGFLLGNELFTPGQPPRVVGVTQELLQKAQGMKAYGTFEAWRAAANSLFALERQGLMVVAGFASVLMAFAQDAGGLIIAAVSEEGGKGKTLGLRGAQTAWGSDAVTAVTSSDTVNSRYKLISMLGGLPVTWDEMRDRDPEVVKDFVLTFSGGRDKNRLDKRAELRANGRNWSTMLIATSNLSVAELVSHDGETAQQARVLEAIFGDLEGVKASDGKEIERQLIANRGHAGRRFIKALMIPGMIDWLRKAVPAYAREFEAALGETRTVLRFYTNGLACMRAAGEILNRAEILEFSVKRITDYAIEVAGGMREKLVDERTDPMQVLTQFLIQTLPTNGLVTNQAWRPKSNDMPRQLPRGTLAIRYEIDPALVYIDRQFLKEWCMKRRVIFSNLARRLKTEGVLIDDAKRVNLGAGTTLAAGGQTSAWACRVKALEGELPNYDESDGKVVLIPGKFR